MKYSYANELNKDLYIIKNKSKTIHEVKEKP